MAIKDVYNQVEKDKKNEVKSSNVSIPMDDFIEEHKRLISILRGGDKKAQMTEADAQEKELMEETGEKVDDNEDSEEDSNK